MGSEEEVVGVLVRWEIRLLTGDRHGGCLAKRLRLKTKQAS